LRQHPEGKKELSENGIVAISVTLDSKFRTAATHTIQTRGSVFSTEDVAPSENLECRKTRTEQFARTPGAKPEMLPTEIRKRIRVVRKGVPPLSVIVPLITYVD
jgi:mRNA degradation ribonuclease J1/J2